MSLLNAASGLNKSIDRFTAAQRLAAISSAAIAIVACLFLPNLAAAAVGPESSQLSVVESYKEDFGVSAEVAERRLAIQARGAAIVGELEAAEGSAFAGVWFDNDSGEFVVPIITPVMQQPVEEVLEEADLDEAASLGEAQYNWTELETAQEELNETLSAQIRDESAQTYLDAETNAVVVDKVGGVELTEDKKVERAASAQGEIAEVSAERPTQIGAHLTACDFEHAACDKPLRGGMDLQPVGTKLWQPPGCTVGFRATGNLFGNHFALTAGHCVPGGLGSSVSAYTATGVEQIVGNIEAWQYPTHDFAAYKVPGSGFWDEGGWGNLVANWGVNQTFPLANEGWSYVGEFVCHDGIQSGKSCGPVTRVNVTEPTEGGGLPPGTVEHYVEFGPIKSIGGDSGGSVFAAETSTALGIYSADNRPSNTYEEVEHEWEHRMGFYTEITEIDDLLGMRVGTRVGGPPTASTGAVGNLQPENAFATGAVNPNAVDTSYHFDWGTSPAYGQVTPVPDAPLGHGSGFVPVSANLGQLQPLSVYHYRLVASSRAGTSYGSDVEFTTPPAAPSVTAVGADPGKLSMTLHATIDGRKSDTHYRFEYGPTSAYGSSIPVPDQDVGSGVTTVNQTINEVEGTYHYRVVATNAGGTTFSPDQEVYVQERPFITPESPSPITGTGGTLRATIDPRGAATTYYFEYGTTKSYGSKTPEASAGSGKGGVKVGAPLTGLEFGTSYHYRVIATNWAGTRIGPDLAFTPGWIPNSPSPSGLIEGEMTDVSCNSGVDCIGLGQSGFEAFSEHWNGEGWTFSPVPRPASNRLESVSCPNSAFCAAVGYLDESTRGVFAARWDGVNWQQQPIQRPPNAGSSILYDVSCSSPSACEAVGWTYYFKGSPIAYRWNGSTWSEQSVPAFEPAEENAVGGMLRAVSCVSTTECMGLGIWESSLSKPVALIGARWNGTAWSLQSMPKPPAASGVLGSGISCPAASTCEAVGQYTFGSLAQDRAPFAERWNGTSWELQTLQLPEESTWAVLSSVSCTSSATCEAVGEYRDSSGVAHPLAERFKAGSWQLQLMPGEGELGGLSCLSETACVAVGTIGYGSKPKSPLSFGYFKSPPVAQVVTRPASSIGETTANLNGTVNPLGVETKMRFEYGTTLSYGNNTAEIPVGSGTTALEESQGISGLQPGTTYHYRIVATNSEYVARGEDRTFETHAAQFSMPNGISALAITDPFNGSTSGTSNFANWTKLPWATGNVPKGEDSSTGWHSANIFGYIDGAVYGPSGSDARHGIAAVATMATQFPYTSEGQGQSFSLWLDLPSPPLSRSGYQLRVQRLATGDYAYLARWSAGKETVLAHKGATFYPTGSSFALVDAGGAVSAWVNTGAGFSELLGASDSTYSSGTAAVEANGPTSRWTNFKFGSL